MKIVIAPDKFKGSVSATGAAAAIARGLRDRFPDAEIIEVPIADGGEGTMGLIAEVLNAERIQLSVAGPLGEPVAASYGLAGASAIIEMSAASGLVLVGEEHRDPWNATTYGTGEMICHALCSGAEEIIVGIGGSATNDGGVGMARALGYEFRHDPDGGLIQIDLPEERPGDLATFIAACDVSNPLLGASGCTRVYGPQKGIKPEDFERHERRLENLARVVGSDVAPVASDLPGAGAAGGLGFGLMAFCGAGLRPGFDLVAEFAGLEQAIAGADLVVTGEGRMDAQTLMGKGPAGVADLARVRGVRVVAFCGIAEDQAALLEQFDAVIPISERVKSAEDSMSMAAGLLEAAARELTF